MSLGRSTLLTLVLVIAFGMLATVFLVLSNRVLSFATDKVLEERQVIAEMTARQIDRFLMDAIARLDEAAASLGGNPSSPDMSATSHVLADLHSRNTFFFLGVRMLDAGGRPILSEPTDPSLVGAGPSGQPHINYVRQFRRKSVSDPFIEPGTGRVVVEITVPVLADDGELVGMLSAVVDLESPNVVGSLSQARDLGETGHADLVDIHGRVLASTEAGPPLHPGDHLEFYRRMGLLRVPTVEVVPHETVESSESESQHHVMAFAPLLEADWGVAVGGNEDETFAPIRRLRNRIYSFAGAAAAIVFIATLGAARFLMSKPS